MKLFSSRAGISTGTPPAARMTARSGPRRGQVGNPICAALEARVKRSPELLVVNALYPRVPESRRRAVAAHDDLWQRRRAINEREGWRGAFEKELLRGAPKGRDVRLTIDPVVQAACALDSLVPLLALSAVFGLFGLVRLQAVLTFDKYEAIGYRVHYTSTRTRMRSMRGCMAAFRSATGCARA